MNTLDIYKQTGTLAPLVNKREYTADEKTVLLHFFTNIDKNVYCATDNMSSQLWAFLVGQYSRSELSMRDRFLKLFQDAKKTFEEGKLPKEEYVSLKDLAKEIKNNKDNSLKYFNDKASNFLKKWGVEYGHNSLKDADRIRFAVEGISQVFTKIIESPFPALGDFQEKSTRYVSFGRESIIIPPTLEKSKYGPEIKKLNNELMDLYLKYIPLVQEALLIHRKVSKEDFEREIAFKNTLKAKSFDICRYLLPSGVKTSLGASFSTRILEMHLSEMLSHENEEARLVAQSMHKEALKISPGLLSHVEKNSYLLKKRKETFKMMNDIFKTKDFEPIQRGLNENQRVKYLGGDDIDTMVLASIFFEYGRQKSLTFSNCLKKAKMLTNKDLKDEIFAEAFDYLKNKIIGSELNDRGKFDRMPRTLQHGSVLFEFTTDFGAYRDYQRHRASPQIWQGTTGVIGYDYPEFIELPAFFEFKQDYDNIMTKMTQLARKVIIDFPYEAEYVSALGHLVRTTYEMSPGQLAYVCELRTTPQGHHSYRKLFQHVAKVMEQEAPIFMKYVRVSHEEEGTRKIQEEKAAEKREKLGLN